MKKRLLLISLFGILLSCQKYEVTTVPGNKPLDDRTISTQTKENYINRLYILLLGRKAESIEFNTSYALLDKAPSSAFNRAQVVEGIMNNNEFFDKLWYDVRDEILDGVDTSELRYELLDFKDRLQKATNPNTKAFYQNEVDRLTPIMTIVDDLSAGNISMQNVHEMSVNNSIYDDINMGTENFVVSVFQNFLYRYPTGYELSESKNMVNNNSAVLFLQTGQGKPKFIKIFFNHSSYKEGQITHLFKKYLFRSPSSEELDQYTQEYINNNNYYNIQKELLASEEYFLN